MFKTALKEIIIVLLLIIAILLLLGILFYEYTPNSRTVPNKVKAYTLNKDTQIELENTLKEYSTDKATITYSITEEDLKKYEKQDEYNKGKRNPFDTVVQEVTNTNPDASTNTNSTSGNNNTNSNTNTNSGTFLNTVGK